MSELTKDQVVGLRQCMAKMSDVVTWNKEQIEVAVKAIDAMMLDNKTIMAFSDKIEELVPGVFTEGQKRAMLGVWCKMVSERLGVI